MKRAEEKAWWLLKDCTSLRYYICTNVNLAPPKKDSVQYQTEEGAAAQAPTDFGLLRDFTDLQVPWSSLGKMIDTGSRASVGLVHVFI